MTNTLAAVQEEENSVVIHTTKPETSAINDSNQNMRMLQQQQQPSETKDDNDDDARKSASPQVNQDDDDKDRVVSPTYHPPPRRPTRRSFRRFSIAESTEQHFSIDSADRVVFVGAYGQLRKRYLDHETYHAHYRKERQWLHDSIIEDFLEYNGRCRMGDENKEGNENNEDDDEAIGTMMEAEAEMEDKDETEDNGQACPLSSSPPQQQPQPQQWLILTVGVPGAGKHHALQILRHQYPSFLPTSYCRVKGRDIAPLLPEYLLFPPQLSHALTEKEAGYIAETLAWAALHEGQSVVWDSALGHTDWWRHEILVIQSRFPSLKIGLLHITAPSVQVVLERRAQTKAETQRHWYPDTAEEIQREMRRIAAAVETVQPLVHASATICNSDRLEFSNASERDSFCHAFHAPMIIRPVIATPSFLPRLVSSSHDSSATSVSELETSSHVVEATTWDSNDQNDLLQPPTTTTTSSSLVRHQRRGTTRRSFHVCQSTEDNHRSNDRHFYGRFADIRATLDYSYHHNYTFERQRFQDALLEDYLQSAVLTDKNGVVCTTPTEPWIVFTAGAMGAGKSYTLRQLVQRGRFPLVAFVNVDPDDLRRKLPEYPLYVEHAPQWAGELTRKEAGFLAEILTLAALQAGKNVLVDGSLRDAAWYQRYFARLRQEFPVLRLAILQVTAPKETILARAASRAEQTGRVVPEPLLLDAYEQVPQSVRVLQHLVDYHATIHNPPDTSDIELRTDGETWDSFTSQWVQTCAWIPRKKKQKELKHQQDSLPSSSLE